MRIAICDDQQEWINVIKEKIEGAHLDQMIELEIDCFINQEALLKASEEKSYDLVYLDIEMEGKNGIEVAKELKRKKDTCMVIFVSAYRGYMNDAFRVAAFQYIYKPIDDGVFYKDLERAVDCFKRNNLIRVFKVKGGRVAFNLNEIICIESYYNTAYIRTTRGTYITNYSNLCKIRKEIMDYDFIRIQAGLIANMNFVVSMKYREVELVNGKVFPISLTHYRKVVEKYHKFLNMKNDYR